MNTYRTLSICITLQILGANTVAITRFAALTAESILIRFTGIAMLTRYSKSALTLSCYWITSAIIRTFKITVTRRATLQHKGVNFFYMGQATNIN